MNKTSKSTSKPRSKSTTKPITTQAEYRAHFEKRMRGQQFLGLVFGMSTREIAAMLRVSEATVKRWRKGESQPPFTALELLRIRRGVALPRVCGDFDGFTLGRVHGKTVLIPPGGHWSDGVTAADVKSWGLVRHMLADHIARRPALAGMGHMRKQPANDAAFALPVDALCLEPVQQQAANDGGSDSNQ